MTPPRAGWRERWWDWLAGLAYRFGGRCADRARRIRERQALPRGTAVRLSAAGCCRDPQDPAHQGVWFVDRYDDDAGDYRLLRDPGKQFPRVPSGDITYARRSVMELVP